MTDEQKKMMISDLERKFVSAIAENDTDEAGDIAVLMSFLEGNDADR